MVACIHLKMCTPSNEVDPNIHLGRKEKKLKRENAGV